MQIFFQARCPLCTGDELAVVIAFRPLEFQRSATQLMSQSQGFRRHPLIKDLLPRPEKKPINSLSRTLAMSDV